jgi:glycosyltransferase involved in cell wall biosynthesis
VALGVVSEAAKNALLGCASTGLNPMTTGGGSNVKVPEYFAAGLPVVSTAYGVRGFDAKAGVHLTLAPIDGFVSAIRSTVAREHGRDMTPAARDLVEREYSWDALGSKMLSRVTVALGM